MSKGKLAKYYIAAGICLMIILLILLINVKGSSLTKEIAGYENIVIETEQEKYQLTAEEADEFLRLFNDGSFRRTLSRVFKASPEGNYHISFINGAERSSCDMRIIPGEAVVVDYVYDDRPQKEARYYIGKNDEWSEYLAQILSRVE